MNLSIRDSLALGNLRRNNIELYLQTHGWRLTGESQNAQIFVPLNHDRTGEVMLPIRETYRDYPIRVFELLHTVANIEERSPLDAFRSMQQVTADVVEISILEAESANNCKISDGVTILQSAKELMLAAACSTAGSKILYDSRRPYEAVEFVDSLKVSVQEGSAFTLNIVSELPPVVSGAFRLPPPFSRLAFLTLSTGLLSVSDLPSYFQRLSPARPNKWNPFCSPE